MSTPVFDPDVVSAVVAHMNEDHRDDALLIVRGPGARPSATQAWMAGLDEHGGDFVAVDGGDEVAVRVPWSRQISERPEIRAEIVVLYREACGRLGVEPRP